MEDDLFQKAIIQSSSALNTWIIDEHPRDFTKSLFSQFADINMDASDDEMEEYFKRATLLEIKSALLSLFVSPLENIFILFYLDNWYIFVNEIILPSAS